MPRCRPGHRLPGPLPSRRRSRCPGQVRTHRLGTVRTSAPDEPVGVAPRRLGPAPLRTTARRTGRPPDVDSVAFVPAPAPLTPTLPSWIRTVFRRPPPEGGIRTDSVPRSRSACALRYGAYVRERITPGQGVFFNSQGYPQNFLVTPRNPAFIHRSCTGRAQDCPHDRRSHRCATVDAARSRPVEWSP